MADLRPVYVAGDGDVKGPASSSNNFLPLFADTTGKLLKSSGTGVTTQGLAILDDNTPAEQRNTIGLDQVNNTSDVNKPVSTAQQTALNLKQDTLLYTPVQQGGGIGQATNKIFIGFGTGRLKATVDNTDFGNVVFDGNAATESAVGVAKIATNDLALAGTDNATIMTPAKTKAVIVQAAPGAATESVAGIARVATQAITNDGTDDLTLVTPKKLASWATTRLLGIGQTWQDVTANRAPNTVYTNTTGKPIQLYITGDLNDSTINIGGVPLTGRDYSGGSFICLIVPVGATYSLSTTSTANLKWMELR